MRKPELNRDYALIQVYKCWHCDFTNDMNSNIVRHIREEHPETQS